MEINNPEVPPSKNSTLESLKSSSVKTEIVRREQDYVEVKITDRNAHQVVSHTRIILLSE